MEGPRHGRRRREGPLTGHLLMRVDFRDYVTAFPTHVIVPAANGTDKGIFHQFTPLAGVSYVF